MRMESMEEFPLLIKIIDARSDLTFRFTRIMIMQGSMKMVLWEKPECWYILDSEPGTKIVIGHYAKDEEELKQMVEEKRWKDLIREVPVKEVIFTRSIPAVSMPLKRRYFRDP